MLKISKIAVIILVFVGLFGFGDAIVLGQSDSIQAEIAALQAKIVELQNQIAVLQARLAPVETVLRLGDKGPQIKLIQEMLATDPEIYPEALITGYYGPLTAKALAKFEAKWGECVFEDDSNDTTTDNTDDDEDDDDDDEDEESDDNSGPSRGHKEKKALKQKTVARINQLLTEGAGNSGKVPPGLLKAPGIRAKFCRAGVPFPVVTTTPPISTSTPPTATTTVDTIAPVVSAIKAKGDKTTAEVKWKTNEKTTGKLWYSKDTALESSATSTGLVSDMSWAKEHEIKLTGLATSTTYYYKIMATDQAGNSTATPVRTFETKD